MTMKPLALPGIVFGLILLASGHPWWAAAVVALGLTVRVTVTRR